MHCTVDKYKPLYDSVCAFNSQTFLKDISHSQVVTNPYSGADVRVQMFNSDFTVLQ